MVYQEQVMQVSAALGGYALGEAGPAAPGDGKERRGRDGEAARCGSWKGRRSNKHSKEKAEQDFDLMAEFAGYGFNKSHSAAYSLLAYHTAWLKTHYPVEFMAALLTSETSKPENVVKYISECKEMGIAVVPPDVQISSSAKLYAERGRSGGRDASGDGKAIRFGLAAIKNVGGTRLSRSLLARAELAEGKWVCSALGVL